MTNDEKKNLYLIKRDFDTRNKWTKQDYVDFYCRDVTLLLRLVGKLSLPTRTPEEGSLLILARTKKEANEYRMKANLIAKNCICISSEISLRGMPFYTKVLKVGLWKERKDLCEIENHLKLIKAIEISEEERKCLKRKIKEFKNGEKISFWERK